eukprot:TRINITY_DN66351_c0_g2_i1.p1 TRINITY_DN66351_c0_g2~~TRINITY_DN66351_c0_g2_i1.p1  ORF type:complete len:372 (+),score=29.69 TRINITY_DN66351_c0_g2_i1:65-1180(+)
MPRFFFSDRPDFSRRARFVPPSPGQRVTPAVGRFSIGVNEDGEFTGHWESFNDRTETTTNPTIVPAQKGTSTVGIVGEYVCVSELLDTDDKESGPVYSRPPHHTGGTLNVLAVEENEATDTATVYMDGAARTTDSRVRDTCGRTWVKIEARASMATLDKFAKEEWDKAVPLTRIDTPGETHIWGSQYAIEGRTDLAFYKADFPLAAVKELTTSPPVAPDDTKQDVSLVGSATSNIWSWMAPPRKWGPQDGRLTAFSGKKGTRFNDGVDTNMISCVDGAAGAGVADKPNTHCAIQVPSEDCPIMHVPLDHGQGNNMAIRTDTPTYMCNTAKHIFNHMSSRDKSIVLKGLFQGNLHKMHLCPREQAAMQQQLQ